MRRSIGATICSLRPEQRVFERLSVFAGGCTLAPRPPSAAVRTSQKIDVFDLLSSLVDKSLVVADLEGSEPRYRLLESFRQYAREKLAARGEQDVVAHRHVLAYLELAQRAGRRTHRLPDEPFCGASCKRNWTTGARRSSGRWLIG